MINKKVLLGCLVSKHHEYCTREFLEGLKLIEKNVDIILIENSDTKEFYNKLIKEADPKIKIIRYGNELKTTQEKLTSCRNYLREIFLKEKYDYFFSLDQDVVVPKYTIKKLISDQKDIVVGVYYNNKEINGNIVAFPVLYKQYSRETQEQMKNNKEIVRQLNPELFKALQKYNWDFQYVHRILTPKEVEGDNIIEIDHCGNACVLIKREVLEKIKFRYAGEFFDDMMFCKDAVKLGYKIYADTFVKCKHLIENRPWKWNNNENIAEIDYESK